MFYFAQGGKGYVASEKQLPLGGMALSKSAEQIAHGEWHKVGLVPLANPEELPLKVRERYAEHRVCWGTEVVIEGGSILRVEGGQTGGVVEFPVVGERVVEVARGPGRQVHEELGEVELRTDIMPATGGREAGEDGSSAAAARVANE